MARLTEQRETYRYHLLLLNNRARVVSDDADGLVIYGVVRPEIDESPDQVQDWWFLPLHRDAYVHEN